MGLSFRQVHRWGKLFILVSPLNRMRYSVGDSHLKLKEIARVWELYLETVHKTLLFFSELSKVVQP